MVREGYWRVGRSLWSPLHLKGQEQGVRVAADMAELFAELFVPPRPHKPLIEKADIRMAT